MSERKLESGNPLIVLGVEVLTDARGVTMWPAQEKVDKWTANIEAILKEGILVGGAASKLCGQLQWGAQSAFRRLGRAMIRPIIAQTRSSSAVVGPELRAALTWWHEVLQLQIRCESASWSRSVRAMRASVRTKGSGVTGSATRASRYRCSATPGAPHQDWQRSCSGNSSGTHCALWLCVVHYACQGWTGKLLRLRASQRGDERLSGERGQPNHGSRDTEYCFRFARHLRACGLGVPACVCVQASARSQVRLHAETL